MLRALTWWVGSRNELEAQTATNRPTAEGEMPLKAYLIAHPEAKISAEELAVLKEWAGISSIEDNRVGSD